MHGDQVMVAYQSIGRTGWKIVSVIPAAKYKVLSIALKQWMVVVLVVVVLLALTLAYVIADSLSRPIRRLSSMMREVERDRFDL